MQPPPATPAPKAQQNQPPPPSQPAAQPRQQPGGFLDLRRKAEHVNNLSDALEPYLQTCRYPEEYLERQCNALKERLMFLGTNRTFRYTVPATGGRGASIVDGKQVVVRACLTCSAPAAVAEGLTGSAVIVGKTPSAVRATSAGLDLQGIELTRAPLSANQAPEKVAQALETEFIFRTRNELAKPVGREHVVLVDVLGFRSYDRCTGKIYAVSPPGDGGSLANVEQKDTTCPGYVKPVVKVEENLPQTLTAEQITKVMEGAREDILVCYDKFGVGGYAPAELTVTGSDGRIKEIKITGKLEGTPTSQCIDKVVRAVTFPRFKDKELHIDWKFFLQD